MNADAGAEAALAFATPCPTAYISPAGNGYGDKWLS